MCLNTRTVAGLAAGALLTVFGFTGCGPGGQVSTSGSIIEPQALGDVPSTDPAWKPSSEQVAVIQVGEKGRGGKLHNFCLATNGNILACWGTLTKGGKGDSQVKVFSPDGKLVSSWPLPTLPQAICVDVDGFTYVGGAGQLLKLDPDGKIVASASSPVAAQVVKLDRTTEKMNAQDAARYTDALQQRKLAITGIAVTGDDLFVACPSTTDFSYMVYRMDRQLQNPKLVVKGLRGCCGQMDIQAGDGKLWVPHNARHLVECYSRDGGKLSSFGKTSRVAADGFGGCCEPKNVRLATDGFIYAAESGPPVVIKRFSTEGKFAGVVRSSNRAACG